MIQGTGSNVGKSLLVAGILRALRLRGLNVAPFKPQNMSNNAAATGDGGEIGRAQALQAKAADVAPHTDMNPVLLKPQSETGAQIIVRGQHRATMDARRYSSYRTKLMPEPAISIGAVSSPNWLVPKWCCQSQMRIRSKAFSSINSAAIHRFSQTV